MNNPEEEPIKIITISDKVVGDERIFRQFHTLEKEEISPELKKDMDDYYKRVVEYKKENNE